MTPRPTTRSSRLAPFLAGAALALAIALPVSIVANPQDGADEPSGESMAEMMQKAQKLMAPGPHHEKLKPMLGDWETSFHLVQGDTVLPGSKGTAKISWLFDGRWLKVEGSSSMMGMPYEYFYIFGYDNFKKSYVAASVSTMDTALHTNEGDLTQHGDALISYGTIDEYLTGEHDKMVKSVWRFISDDEMVMEIHDLPIGEKNTKVVEIRYTRKD